MNIPVDKIFLMLSHAAGFTDLSTYAPVAAAGIAGHSDYLAAILAEAGERSLRSGVPQQYLARRMQGRSLRGRIDFPRQIRNDQRGSLALCCIADELGYASPINRLVKTAALRLARSPEVSVDSVTRLRRLAGLLYCEPFTSTAPQVLEGVRRSRVPEVHVAAAFIAWLAVAEQGFDVGQDGVVFGWPTTAQQLGLLFQEFVRRRLEMSSQQGVRVAADNYALHRAAGVKSAREILPEFRTDIVLTSASQVMVIETKLTPPLVSATWAEASFRRFRLRTQHLAQLLAYLEHASLRYSGRRIRGVLLYGSCAPGLVARFPLGAYDVAVVAIDLRASDTEVCAAVADVAALMRSDDALGVGMGDFSAQPE